MHLQVDLLFCTFKFRLKELSIFEIWNRPLGRFSYKNLVSYDRERILECRIMIANCVRHLY